MSTEPLTCGICNVPAPNAVMYERTGGYCPDHAWLTIPEAFALLRISRATYYRYVKAGRITQRQFLCPIRILVPRSDIDALLEQSGPRRK